MGSFFSFSFSVANKSVLVRSFFLRIPQKCKDVIPSDSDPEDTSKRRVPREEEAAPLSGLPRSRRGGWDGGDDGVRDTSPLPFTRSAPARLNFRDVQHELARDEGEGSGGGHPWSRRLPPRACPLRCPAAAAREPGAGRRTRLRIQPRF